MLHVTSVGKSRFVARTGKTHANTINLRGEECIGQKQKDQALTYYVPVGSHCAYEEVTYKEKLPSNHLIPKIRRRQA